MRSRGSVRRGAVSERGVVGAWVPACLACLWAPVSVSIRSKQCNYESPFVVREASAGACEAGGRHATCVKLSEIRGALRSAGGRPRRRDATRRMSSLGSEPSGLAIGAIADGKESEPRSWRRAPLQSQQTPVVLRSGCRWLKYANE